MCLYVVCGSVASDDSTDSSHRHTADSDSGHQVHTADNVFSTERQTRRRQRSQVVKKRRRIMQDVDSSTEDDLDIANNNNVPLPIRNKSDQNIIPQSVVTFDSAERKQEIPFTTSIRETTHSEEFTGSGRLPNLNRSGQPELVKRSVQSMQSESTRPADCITESGRTSLIGSRQSDSISRSVLSIQPRASHPVETIECLSARVNTPTDTVSHSVKSLGNVTSSNAGKITSNLAANDVATFSLAFDDFLDSDHEDEDQVTEYTRLKAPKDRISAFRKTDSDSPDVDSFSFSQAVESCRSAVSRSDYTTVSGRPGLIGSVQPSSEVMSLSSLQSKTVTSVALRSCSSTVPRFDCTSGSGQLDLTGSWQPSSVTTMVQTEVERLREERIRLSRAKKEEFQRKFANTSSFNRPPMNPSPTEMTSSNHAPTNISSMERPLSNQLRINSSSVERTLSIRPQTNPSPMKTASSNYLPTASSDHPQTNPSASSASAKNVVDDAQTKLQILVDSRELSGAQVRHVLALLQVMLN